MNPSSSGWIKKLLQELPKDNHLSELGKDIFYDTLRASGFIYGSNLNIVSNIFPKGDFSEEELCKTNLILSLFYSHSNTISDISFIESIIDFYTYINEFKSSFFHNLIADKKSSEYLEKIIHKRIQIDGNILTKNFNYFIINALLYVDVLAYNEYLKKGSINIDYLKNLEASIVAMIVDALNSKESKNQYDDSLIKLFESSLRYHESNILDYDDAIGIIKNDLEKYYILDLACMSTWSDLMIDANEQHFLEKLGSDLQLNTNRISESIKTVNLFYTINKDNIALLGSKNIVQSFYNNSSKMVHKLITRNSKRLYQEILDSKELMVLITHSTVRDLTKEEQKKVQDQLLDIFKSIPSLAIFMLPGGALLLPLVVKFIPKLLPSAFDENRIDD